MKYKTKICIIDPDTCLVEHWEGELEPKSELEFKEFTLVERLVQAYFSDFFTKSDKYDTQYAIGVEYYEPC